MRLPSGQEPGDERVSLGDEVVLPGGKVDPEALRRAVELQREQAGGEDEVVGRVVFTLQRDLNKRLDKYLTDRITFMSRNQLQKLIAGGGVTVNDRVAKPSTNLRRGDVVEVMIPEPPPAGIQPEAIPLEALYEDEHLIVINKAPDMIVHPARSHLKGTMINALAWRFEQAGSGSLSSVGDEFARPGVVHRLDRHTSGVIVFAKTDEAHWKLGHLFEHRRVEKRYLALVHGRVEPAVDVIDLPLGPHPSREKGYREKQVVRHDEQGKAAVTIYRVRELYHPHAADPAERFSLLEIELKTGRTHQIRVHLSHLGWPIVGDDMYGGRAMLAPDGRAILARQGLHAALLAFTHPMTGVAMTFAAPLRADMAEAIRGLRIGREASRVVAPGTILDVDGLVGAS
ncbi:MAG: RluA family pseudouridine synthase [Phycisphaerales bacterium]